MDTLGDAWADTTTAHGRLARPSLAGELSIITSKS